MSERHASLPSKPATTETASTLAVPSMNGKYSSEMLLLNQSLKDLESKLEPANDQKPERPGLTPELDPIELSPEEQTTKARLEKTTELRIHVHGEVAHYINKAHQSVDTTKNLNEKAVKKATLLEYRDGAKSRKSTRLSARLDKTRPGSMRYRRLSRKLAETNIKRDYIRGRAARIDSAAGIRANHYAKAVEFRAEEIWLRRDMLKIEKKVALEKKNRRQITKEMKNTTDEAQRQWLKSEINGWPSIGQFRQGLLDRATEDFKKRQSEKQEARMKSDYDLAA